MLRPKCIVFKAKLAALILTDANLEALGVSMPLALECINCQRRQEDKLEKFCWKDV